MLSSIARYMKAWNAADRQEKDRILQLMKESVGMAGDIQQMELRGAAEQRVKQLFPGTYQQQQQQIASAGIGLQTQRREEEGAQEAEASVREQFGYGPQTSEAMRKGQLDEFQRLLYERLVDIGVPSAEAMSTLSDARARAEGSEVKRLTYAEQLKQRQPEISVREQVARSTAGTEQARLQGEVARETREAGYARAAGEGATEQARLGQETAQARRQVGVPTAAARAERATAEAAESKARADQIKSDIQRQISEILNSTDYIEIAADAATSKLGLENEVLRAQIDEIRQKARAGQVADFDKDFLLYQVLGPEQYANMAVQEWRQKMGDIPTRMSYYNDIRAAYSAIANIQSAVINKDNFDEFLAYRMQGGEQFQAWLAGKGEDPNNMEMPEVIAELNRYADAMKANLMRDYGEDYNLQAAQGAMQQEFTEDEVSSVLTSLESDEPLTGIGAMIQKQFKPGFTPAYRDNAIRFVMNLLNKSKSLTNFDTIIEEQRERLVDSGYLTNRDIDAAKVLLDALVEQRLGSSNMPPGMIRRPFSPPQGEIQR